ncbi:ADP-ribosylation factor-like protein 5A [Labeo rohita]|uniref:ADP-ribosylation factor-like protein 5A n=1 Tax=Labeo rohita TaxID=84645 RepID=A0ABQ8MDA8_LABRO|nr:ADP-ribosylation factor-like protein 5A [Labeo rohita]
MNEVVHTSPTIGSNVEEIVVNNTHFLMWDIGGQESLRSSWNTYYTNTEFVIVVVDSTDRERISVTREELYRMLAHEAKSSAYFRQRPSVAHPGLLCPHWRRALPGSRMDDVTAASKMTSDLR